MRVLTATAMMVALWARGAAGQGSKCMYANEFFTPGSVSCQNGRQYRCVAGSWQPNGLECADTKADADEAGVDVDPSRRAPKVRQPSAPSVPQD